MLQEFLDELVAIATKEKEEEAKAFQAKAECFREDTISTLKRYFPIFSTVYLFQIHRATATWLNNGKADDIVKAGYGAQGILIDTDEPDGIPLIFAAYTTLNDRYTFLVFARKYESHTGLICVLRSDESDLEKTLAKYVHIASR